MLFLIFSQWYKRHFIGVWFDSWLQVTEICLKTTEENKGDRTHIIDKFRGTCFRHGWMLGRCSEASAKLSLPPFLCSGLSSFSGSLSSEMVKITTRGDKGKSYQLSKAKGKVNLFPISSSKSPGKGVLIGSAWITCSTSEPISTVRDGALIGRIWLKRGEGGVIFRKS